MSVSERLTVLRSRRGRTRKSTDFPRRPRPQLNGSAELRLQSWRQLRGLDERSALHDPTKSHACSESELLAILDDAQFVEYLRDAVPPPWASAVNTAWESGKRRLPRDAEPPSASGRDVRLAFLPILAPLIEEAAARVEDGVQSLRRSSPVLPFAEELLASARSQLEMRLGDLLARTAVLELHAARLAGELVGASPEERFDAFIRRISSISVAEEILRRSPVLARLAFTISVNWAEGTIEFLQRLVSDWSIVRRVFLLHDRDRAHRIIPTGDLHRAGRAVLRIEFESGRTLIYKPRSVEIELRFQKLIARLSSLGGFPDLARLRVVSRGSHGWMEFAETHPCQEEEESALYERHGALLAILHVLAGSDCHFENIVVDNANPVVVDLEGLFNAYPSGDLDDLSPVERDVIETTSRSVLAVGLLPMRRWSNASGRSIDTSGLGAQPIEWSRARSPQWERPYTDEMHEVIEEANSNASDAPVDTSRDALYARLDDLVDGFSRAYRALLRNRSSIIGESGVLDAFSEVATRAILRPTGHYLYLLQSASNPHFLADGISLDERFDRLIARVGARPDDSLVAAAERKDLWQMDIPYFWTLPRTTDVFCSDGSVIHSLRAETGLEAVRRRMASMSDADLSYQSWLIRLSVTTWALNRHSVDERERRSRLPLPRKSCVDELAGAQILARRLRQLAVRNDGEATWIGMHYRPGDDSWAVEPVGPSLFDGTAGIALFLSYLDAITSGDHHDLATEAFRTFRRQVERTITGSATGISVGFSGIGGWLHTLAHLASLWQDNTLLTTASDLLPHLRESLDSAVTVDVIGGAAGAIRPLLSLFDLTGSSDFLACARLCGDQILARAEPQSSGIGWSSPAGRIPLSGFSHGVAGVSWALLKVYEKTGDRRYKAIAAEGLTYERSLFSETARNWRDLRLAETADDVSTAPCLPFWCNGAAGIGLARLDNSHIYADAETSSEIKDAVEATATHGLGFNHSLCHGFGTAAELLMLAEAAGLRDPPRSPRRSWGEQMVASIRSAGYVTGAPRGLEIPGLMMGLAGIGYGLLRLQDPERVPSVALLEPPASACKDRTSFSIASARSRHGAVKLHR